MEHDLELQDMDAWDSFVAANREALESEYTSIDNALRHALDGGLTLGGGAAPLVNVYFKG